MKKKDLLFQIIANLKEEWVRPAADSSVSVKNEQPEKVLKLKALESNCLKCTKCGLYKTAANLVFSDGSPDARLVFIGEAPGADEDAQGKPFVGRAGKLLTSTIEQFGLPRKEVYICNILKHRPPENRNPLPHEIEACTPYLIEQLKILMPKVIITLGNFSSRFILNTEEGISRLRGTIKNSPLGYAVLPTYHPAAILRNINLLKDFQDDILKALNYINQ